MSESLFAEFRRLSPRVSGGLARMREATYADGEVPAKYKLLAALVVSAAIRCQPCIHSYARVARERGASEQELIEFLNVAITMQGCPGEEWAIKALAAFRRPEAGGPEQESGGCCEAEGGSSA